jgi:hypothetical protein
MYRSYYGDGKTARSFSSSHLVSKETSQVCETGIRNIKNIGNIWQVGGGGGIADELNTK